MEKPSTYGRYPRRQCSKATFQCGARHYSEGSKELQSDPIQTRHVRHLKPPPRRNKVACVLLLLWRKTKKQPGPTFRRGEHRGERGRVRPEQKQDKEGG